MTITLPDSGTTPANNVNQLFIVTMPPGVSNTPGSTTGTFAVWSNYLQTQGGSAPPAAALLNVVRATSDYVTSSFVPSTIAAGAGNNATLVTLPMGTGIPAGGCSLALIVTSIAAASALSQMKNTGTTATSPYTDNTLPVYSFTMATVSSGSLYVSYHQPITYPTAPTLPAGDAGFPLGSTCRTSWPLERPPLVYLKVAGRPEAALPLS